MPKTRCDCCGYETDLHEWSEWHLCPICYNTPIGTILADVHIDLNNLAMAIAWISNDILDAINSTKYREPQQ